MEDLIRSNIMANLGVPAHLFFPRGHYVNPFDFIEEFDNWFEFYRRHYFDKETTHNIVRDMLRNDPNRAMRAFNANYSSAILDFRVGLFKGMTS